MRLQAGPDAAGQRLDSYLALQLPQYSRARLQDWIRQGRVRVDGTGCRPNRRLQGGETLEVEPAPPPRLQLEPATIPLEILYSDDDLLVLVKPAGMVVHPGAGTRSPTLVHALLGLDLSLSRIGGRERPGIVHRLDKDTSGVMVVARNDRVHRDLSEAFRQRRIHKEYRAICWGRPRVPVGLLYSANHVFANSSKEPSRFGRPISE